MTEIEQLGSNTGILIQVGGNVKGTKKTNKSGEKGLCFESKVFHGKQRLNILEKGLNQERHFF